MLTIEQALQAVLERTTRLAPRARALADALGCVLAENVAADLDAPPFDKALVDGYAVRTSDLASGGHQLVVGEEIPAGQVPSRPLGPCEAALLMTGAPLPAGSDAVVMIERTRREGNAVLVDDKDLLPGRNRMTKGREMRAGEVVLHAGCLLTPTRLGLLASVGRARVRVIPPPRVIVLATGDELVEPDQVPGPGQIRNSNSALLRGFVASTGSDVEVLPIAPDEREPLERALKSGLDADILLITGGVSAGNRDLVPETLASLSVEPVFHKVRLKPGKPLWFGVGPRRGPDAPGTLVFGLPGNPVSGVVGFLLFVRPALDDLAGRPLAADRSIPARLAQTYAHSGDRPTYHPAQLDSDAGAGALPAVKPLNWAGSADLRTVVDAEGFAVFPAGEREYEPGEIVRVLPLG
jgi:molybdopterin molybdotransferase